MSRIVFSASLFAISFSLGFGQSVEEALLYSNDQLLGSPRYVALGGAMGALGNDFSTVHDNPAGLSVFRRDRAEFSLGYGIQRTKANHYGQSSERSEGGFSLAQGGLVKGLATWNDEVNRYHFGLSFRRMAQFDQEFLVSGQNPESSIIDQWIVNSNGTDPAQLINQGWLYEGMAWEGFLTDVLDSSNWSYTSFATGLDLQQDRRVVRSGGRDEILISLAGSHDHSFFYGASLGIPFLSFNEESFYTESGFDEFSDVNDFSLIDRYTLNAVGVFLQLGMQYRINYWWRVGASYRSPSWFWSNASFDTELTTNFRDGGTAGPIAYFNDQISYRLSAPQRWSLSSAFVMGKSGFLSLEYRGVDMGHQRFQSADFNLEDIDRAAEESLQWVNELRVGTEYRLAKWSARAGYQWASSVYKNEGSALNARQTLSLGLGYQMTKWRLDLAWRSHSWSSDHFLYAAQVVAPSRLNQRSNWVVMGATFNL